MKKDALAIKLPLYLSSLALWARIWEISFHPPNRITIWLMEISQNSYRTLTEILQKSNKTKITIHLNPPPLSQQNNNLTDGNIREVLNCHNASKNLLPPSQQKTIWLMEITQKYYRNLTEISQKYPSTILIQWKSS